MTATNPLSTPATKAAEALGQLVGGLAVRAGATALVSWFAGLSVHGLSFLHVWAGLVAAVILISHSANAAGKGWHISKSQYAGVIREAEQVAIAAAQSKLRNAGK